MVSRPVRCCIAHGECATQPRGWRSCSNEKPPLSTQRRELERSLPTATPGGLSCSNEKPRPSTQRRELESSLPSRDAGRAARACEATRGHARALRDREKP